MAPLPAPFRQVVRRIASGATAESLLVALQRWELLNQTVTRLLLAQCHHVTAPGRFLLTIGGSTLTALGSPIAPIVTGAGLVLSAESVLEWGILRLKQHYEQRGLLTDPVRLEFEQLMFALLGQKGTNKR